jgi:hypothetical protein
MKIYKEIYDLDDFEFWGPAEDTMRDLSDEDKKVVFEAIEETYPDGLTETELNDILAYDDDWIRDIVGYDYSNYESKEDMEEKQIEYIVDVLKGAFPDYDEEDMNNFAECIVEDGEYDNYDDEGLCRNFIDECGEDHANSVLDDEISGYDDQKKTFIENDWDYYVTDEKNVEDFREYLNEDEEYQQDLKESWDEICEDDKRHER